MTLASIRAQIDTAAQASGRNPGDVTLVAVSKVQPLDRVRTILVEGQRIFGENRVQEAAGKWPDFRAQFDGVDLHLIGPLQTNKVRAAMALFDVIHSVDRPRLAQAIARIAQDSGACPDLFVQVDTGAEPQKAGVAPADADALVATCRALSLPVIGLMCIPPAADDPVPHFAELASIAARNGLTGLSMGMSGDFAAAIAQGATHVRIGSAIFGERVPPPGPT